MKRPGFWMFLLGVIGLGVLVSNAPAQTPRDSAIAKPLKAASDSITKLVVPALVEACDNRRLTARQKLACPSYGRLLASIQRSESLLVATVIVPPAPVPIPTPPPVVVPPVPVPVDTSSLAEPAFDASKSTMVYQENFDAYTADSLRPPCRSTGTIVDHALSYSTQCGGSGGLDGSVKVGPGHSGSGLQWHYDGVYQETHGVILPDTAARATGKSTTVVQYWAKFAPDVVGALTTVDANGTGNAIVQIKNIMLWHENGTRFQIMTHAHFACTYGPSYSMLGVIDQAEQPCTSDQPLGPFFKDFANSQWHRWTILYKPNTAQGSRDGVARLWIDGTLVIRIEKSACGVTPPGGWKPWCDVTELDALYSGAYGVGSLEWGANRTDQSGIAFTMAIDDVKWWKLN
jgi:hypothetical protein